VKIIFKKDWDLSINAPIDKKERGHFVGRKIELHLLVNEILRRNSGAILVSGYRGVGKTSLVYKALWKVKSYSSNNVIVLLNASQLEAELEKTDRKIRPRTIIENLVRRLYATTEERSDFDDDTKTKIEKLYRKTVATEFKLRENYRQKLRDSLSIEEENIKEIWFSEKNMRNVIFVICWTIACFFLFGNIISSELINKLFALLLAFPIPFFVNISIKHKRVKKSSQDVSKFVEELYEFDDTIGNLEFDLEEIHRDIENQKKKLIYIIDELDKLETVQVLEVLKFFKNLFTISNAIFIFIGGEDIFKIGSSLTETEEKNGIYRSKAYTYFTSRYFLSRPLWNDLKEFFAEIFVQEDMDAGDLETLERSIAFDAKNDFFDLRKFLKDKITNFSDEGKPIIEIDELSFEDVQKARFQKSVTALFEDRYVSHNPSMWYENEKILRTLFNYAHKIYKSYSGTQFNDPNEERIEDEVIRDFNNFLWRNEAFDYQTEDLQTIKGVPIPIRNYSYVGSIPKDPPDFFSTPTEIEERFVRIFEDYSSYILTLNNVFQEATGEDEITKKEFWHSPTSYVEQINSWSFNAKNIFNSTYPLYKNIIQRNFLLQKREEIEQKIEQISAHIKSMIINLPIIISQMLVSLNQGLKNQQLNTNNSLFGGSANEIRKVLIPHNPNIVFNSDLSRQILLIFNQLDTFLSIKKHIRDNSRTHRVGCVITESVERRIRGLHFINGKSPEDLKRSLNSFMRTIGRFLER